MVRKKTPKTRKEVKEALEEVKTKSEARVDELVVAVTAAAGAPQVKGVTVEKVGDTLGKLQADTVLALDGLKYQLAEKIHLSEELDAAICEQKAELEKLYDNETVAMATGDLLEQHNEKVEFLEKVYQEKLDSLRAKAAELETNFHERSAELKKTREREEAEHDYQFECQTKARHDELAEELSLRRKEYESIAYEQSKNHRAREDALRQKENEYRDAIAAAEVFAKELDAAKTAAYDSGYTKAVEVSTAAYALEKADAQKDLELQQAKIVHLQTKVAELQQALDRAEGATAAANARVESISKAALDSAAGRGALEASQAMAAQMNTGDKRR